MRAIIRAVKYIVIGTVFGIIMTKSEAVSWYRIQEMFRFQSFFMYGIIGSAVILGIILVAIIKEYRLKDFYGRPIHLSEKDKRWKKYLIGGSIFGMGWALTGACPGPIYALIGSGALVMIAGLISAIAGTWVYGLLSEKLPH